MFTFIKKFVQPLNDLFKGIPLRREDTQRYQVGQLKDKLGDALANLRRITTSNSQNCLREHDHHYDVSECKQKSVQFAPIAPQANQLQDSKVEGHNLKFFSDGDHFVGLVSL